MRPFGEADAGCATFINPGLTNRVIEDFFSGAS
jgi:hypothetical protein